eukprot:6187250-Pleurochrysis_carterae.AAC.1
MSGGVGKGVGRDKSRNKGRGVHRGLRKGGKKKTRRGLEVDKMSAATYGQRSGKACHNKSDSARSTESERAWTARRWLVCVRVFLGREGVKRSWRPNERTDQWVGVAPTNVRRHGWRGGGRENFDKSASASNTSVHSELAPSYDTRSMSCCAQFGLELITAAPALGP